MMDSVFEIVDFNGAGAERYVNSEVEFEGSAVTYVSSSNYLVSV